MRIILADDLSGALEVAGGWHLCGHRVAVPLKGPVLPPHVQADACVTNTDSRGCGPAEAARRVRQALGDARGAFLAYKKVDSTLRGPVAAELSAVLADQPERKLLVAPANPAAGRTVQAGVLHVEGVPVAETVFGQDPLSPVLHSRIADIVAGSGLPPPVRLPLSAVRLSFAYRQGAMADALSRSPVVVADAVTDQDLHRLAEVLWAVGESVLPVGSGGLAAALAVRQGAARRLVEEPPAALDGPVLVVCGSRHPASRRQVARLAREASVTLVEVDPLVAQAVPPKACAAYLAERIEPTLRRERVAAVSVGDTPAGGPTDAGNLAGRLVTVLAHTVAALEDRVGLGGLLATGGQTGQAICEALGGQWLAPIEQIAPALVAARLHGGGREPLVLLKPGGFGDQETMLRAWQWLCRQGLGRPRG